MAKIIESGIEEEASIKDPAMQESLQDSIRELEEKIAKAEEDRVSKVSTARENFKVFIEQTSAKYLTVNGYVKARELYREAGDVEGVYNMEAYAALAVEMSKLVTEIGGKAYETSNGEELGKVLDGYYDHEFCKMDELSHQAIAYQLGVTEILQQIDNPMDSIFQFEARADEELETMRKELVELKEKQD